MEEVCVDAGQMVQELLMEEDEVSALTMQHDECFEIPVVCRWVERMSDALLFGCRCLLNHPDTRHEFQRHRNRYIVFTHFLVIILLPALRSRIRISEAGSDKYMHEIHAAMKTPLFLPSPPHSSGGLFPFMFPNLSNWHVKHKTGKVDSAPLCLPRTAICFSTARDCVHAIRLAS
jgi:hypothetical protein